MPNFVPPGYAGMVPLVITNTSSSATLVGSTTTPVAASSTDYVATAHLGGAAAAAVYAGALDRSAFTDVTVWWTDSSGTQVQIDCDYDTTSNGPWSSSSVVVRFRLQASLAAGATSGAYVVAFGNPTPNVLRNWDNIYPFWDTFGGTTLDSTKWTGIVGTGGAVSVNGGLLVAAASGGVLSGVQARSPYHYGPGYLFEAAADAALPSVLYTAAQAGIALGASLYGPGSGAGSSLCYDAAGGWQGIGLYAVPPDRSWGVAYMGTFASSGAHYWRVGRDAAGSSYAYFDQDSAQQTASPQQFATVLPPMVYVNPQGAAPAMQISASWVKLWSWGGPTTTYSISAGETIYKSGTTIASSVSAAPLVRAGGRSIARSAAAPEQWLALYSDGTSALSRRGGSAAALASATPATISGAASGVQGGVVLASGSDGTALAVFADTSTGHPPDLKTYDSTTGTWSAGNTTGLPPSAVWAGTLYDSGSTVYWHLLSALAGGTTLQHWVATAQGGPFTALSFATTAALPSSDPGPALALYAGNVVCACIEGTGHIAYATLDGRAATSGGSSVAASTIPLSGGALQTSENLALLNSADDGSGDLYAAYNNGSGMCCRASTAGGPLSWSAELQISTTASDGSPALVRDGTGAVTLFWIGGSAGQPIYSVRLQVVAGTLAPVGSVLMCTNYAATRSLLTCVPSAPGGVAGLVWLES